MLVPIAVLAAGLVLLAWGADRFVLGAAATGRYVGFSPLLVGMVIVGFATSAPELLVSGIAAINENPGLAVGNALGSNIANVGLVLGCTALVRPVLAGSRVVRRELPLLVVVTAAAAALMIDGEIGRGDGLILLAALAVVLGWLVREARRVPETDPMARELTAELPSALGLRTALAWLVVGLVALLAGAQLAVTSAEALARELGVSDLIIGLTVVAVGTSLPELAVNIAGVLKGEYALALGNIIGSNLFNLLAVIGLAAALHPAALDPSVLLLHYPVMAALTLALAVMAYNGVGRAGLGRLQGVVLLSTFIIYHAYLITQNL